MRELPKLTDRRSLNGLSVGPACLGMIEDADVVPAAFEAGVNMFFISADMHWPLYEPLRRGLTRLLADKPAARDDIVIAAVSYVTQPEFCWSPFEELLMTTPALQRLDVLVAGGCYGHEFGKRLPVYTEHVANGFLGARALAASFHDRDAAMVAVGTESVDLGFVRYNPVFAGARDDVYAARKTRTLLYNFKSTVGCLDDDDFATLGIGDDFWRPHITDYYRFAFTRPAVDGVLCSFPSVRAIRELSDALAKGPLDADDEQYLLDLAALKSGTAKLSVPASSSASRAAS